MHQRRLDNQQRTDLIPSLEAFDGEFGFQDNDTAHKAKTKPRVRLVTLLVLLFGISLVGLIVVPWPLTGSTPRPNEQIEGLMRERTLLKNQISDLTAAQRETAITIAVLDATLQELRRGVPANQYWYTDLAALYFRSADGQSSTAASVSRMSTEVSSPEPSASNGLRRDPGAPLSLLPPQ